MYLSLCWKDHVPVHRSLMGFPVRTAKNAVHTPPNSQSPLYNLFKTHVCQQPCTLCPFFFVQQLRECSNWSRLPFPQPPSHPTAPQKHAPTRRESWFSKEDLFTRGNCLQYLFQSFSPCKCSDFCMNSFFSKLP